MCWKDIFKRSHKGLLRFTSCHSYTLENILFLPLYRYRVAYVTYGNNNKHFNIARRQNDSLGGEMNPNICLLVAYRADAPMIPSPSLTVPLKCNF